ncbi:MAG: hypothetical protein ABJM18_18440, partial [Hyphomonas sp.]
MTGLILALLSLGGAEFLRRSARGNSLKTLGMALTLMGTLGLAGWVGWEFREVDDGTLPTLLIALIMTASALWFRSALLAAFAVLSLGAILGSGTGYWHASYALFVEEPTITIIVFGLLAAGLYHARKSLADAWANLVTVSARTAFFMMNFGFWVGSLWGDRVGEHWFAPSRWSDRSEWRETALAIPDHVFTLGWIGALVAVIATSRRSSFLSITSIVFLTIHGYTQYFEYLGAKPETLVVGGLVLVGLAVAGARFLMRPNAKTA